MIRALLLAFVALCAVPGSAQTLSGFAVLPAQTFVPGPTSGRKIEVKDGLVALPFRDAQPIQGISSLWRLSESEFLALEDNGYGSKANSRDFAPRLLRLKFDFNPSKGKAARLNIVSTLELRDPKRLVTWPLVRRDRVLTGADFDPESLVVARDGTLWIGDEFGPFLLHFSAFGELLDAPFALAGVASPDDPLGRTPTIKSSRGFEGMGLWPNGLFLFPLLEGALDGQQPNRLPMFQFDLNSVDASFHSFPDWAKPSFYPLEPAPKDEKPHSIGEATCVDYGKFLVIERDGLEGDAARFKRIYLWNQLDNSKTLVADLLHISDPKGLASSSKNGVYAMPFQTIESVALLDNRHVLVCNDNNFPFGRGRGKTQVEATEFAFIELPAPLF
jgi:hypothetical protein